jgi:hypothetical protein
MVFVEDQIKYIINLFRINMEYKLGLVLYVAERGWGQAFKQRMVICPLHLFLLNIFCFHAKYSAF